MQHLALLLDLAFKHPGTFGAGRQMSSFEFGATRKRPMMSAEARARIGAATKARWAAGKMGIQSKKKVAAKPAKKKRTLSAPGRAKIAAAQKARWAKKKATAK